MTLESSHPLITGFLLFSLIWSFQLQEELHVLGVYVHGQPAPAEESGGLLLRFVGQTSEQAMISEVFSHLA